MNYIDFMYIEAFKTPLFDIPFSVITWFSLMGYAIKAIISRIYGRTW